MTETKLKLVKSRKKQTLISKVAEPKTRPSRSAGQITALPALTPAERAEAARFRALTAAKAARQAMIHQIMSELQDLDETQSAA